MSAAENLRAARALIADPKHWTQGALGRDGSGATVLSLYLERAVCFCSAGAVFYALDGQPADHAFKHLEQTMQFNVAHFNDTHTHAEVLAAFDKAIELAEAA